MVADSYVPAGPFVVVPPQSMKKLTFLLGILACSSLARATCINKTTSDSLADVFPLAIGTQWIYSYDYEYRDGPVILSLSDTGNVIVHIIGRIDSADTTYWMVQQTGTHWTKTNDQPWSGPVLVTNTSEVVESKSGSHAMYRTGDLSNLRMSVLPFLPDFSDTERVCRYATVDSSGTRSFVSSEYPAQVPVYSFRFRSDIGLDSVSMSDGCTCLPYYWTRHTLRGEVISGIAPQPAVSHAGNAELSQNYPNPFNPTTTIRYALPQRSHVRLAVFNTLGQQVGGLVDAVQEPGEHSVRFDGSGLASGVYFYRLRVGEFMKTKRLLLVR